MRFLFSIFFLITAIYSLSGQYSYHIKISSLPDDYPTAAVQINGGTIILSTIRGDYSSQEYHTVLYKISGIGMIKDSLTIADTCISSCIYELSSSENNEIMGIGSSNDSAGNSYLWLISIDTSMTLLSEKYYLTPFNNTWATRNLNNYQGNVIIAGTSDISGTNSLFFYEVSENFDSINALYMLNQGFPWIWDIIEQDTLAGYKVFVTGYSGITNSHGQVMELDNDFNLIGFDSIPRGIYFYTSAKKKSDTSY
jgi:hypothetical protein